MTQMRCYPAAFSFSARYAAGLPRLAGVGLQFKNLPGDSRREPMRLRAPKAGKPKSGKQSRLERRKELLRHKVLKNEAAYRSNETEIQSNGALVEPPIELDDPAGVGAKSGEFDRSMVQNQDAANQIRAWNGLDDTRAAEIDTAN
jgi:hypothetical protein